MKCDIYKFDLANRFPDYTFTETSDGDAITYEITNNVAAGATVETITRYGETNVVCAIREMLVGGDEILPLLTTTQRDTLSSVVEGTEIFNITTEAKEVYYNGSWY
jgi:hypothetical protein